MIFLISAKKEGNYYKIHFQDSIKVTTDWIIYGKECKQDYLEKLKEFQK